MNIKDIMSSSVLHYPSIEFYDDTWLKACLCIWDNVYRIVPANYVPHDSDETKRAKDLGLVQDLFLSKEELAETAKDFEAFWDDVPFIPAGVEGFEEDEYIRLHPEKVDVRIRPYLETLAKKVDPDGGLKLSPEVANAYMLFLSENVSKQRQIPKITPNDDMYAIMHYFQNNGNFDELFYTNYHEEVTASLVIPNVLPKSLEYIDINKVVEFRNQNEENRIDFRHMIQEVSDGISKIENQDHARSIVNEFVQKLEKNRTNYSKTLKVAISELPLALLTIGLPTTLATIGSFSSQDNIFDLTKIASGCFIGAIASLGDAARSIRANWSSKESNYLLKLNQVFNSEKGIRFRIKNHDRILEEFIND